MVRFTLMIPFAAALAGYMVAATSASAVPQPPCTGDSYGTAVQARAIELAMFSGTTADVENAIRAAKQTRGDRLGCAESTYAYEQSNFQEPTLQQIINVWEGVHAPRIANYSPACPSVGRDWASVALGMYYARAAGRGITLDTLAEIAKTFDAIQYRPDNAPSPLVNYQGVYGYLRTSPTDPCYRGGIIGSSVEQFCTQFPQFCQTFNGGLFANRQFVVGDIIPEQQFFDGGMGFDHGYAGVMMFEAALNFPPRKFSTRFTWSERSRFMRLQARFNQSANLAAEWAVAEPPVRNHNYTAKLIWLLAEAYNVTGDERFKKAMLDKLERNLKLGVLMDQNNDGMVDGVDGIAFNRLTLTAQRPGRNWDAHNALPWYLAKNAWAMTEAYVALRDRGDDVKASELRPYVFAMLDNLAWETNNLGVRNVQTGQYDITQSHTLHALLIGAWKVSAYEGHANPEWERAINALWNTGLGKTFGGYTTLDTGLLMLYKSGISYRPPNQ